MTMTERLSQFTSPVCRCVRRHGKWYPDTIADSKILRSIRYLNFTDSEYDKVLRELSDLGYWLETVE